MQYQRQNSNVKVTLLDLSKDVDEGIRYLMENRKDDAKGLSSLRARYEVGIIQAKDGSLYAVDRDGIGDSQSITDERPLRVELYAEYVPDADGAIAVAMVPTLILTLGPDDIKARLTDKQENLHNFIRSFGARIERNYREWNEAMSPLL